MSKTSRKRKVRLTELEIEVLKLIGLPNQDIADRLNLTLQGVKSALFRIFIKMGVDNRTSAALFAMENRIVQRIEYYCSWEQVAK